MEDQGRDDPTETAAHVTVGGVGYPITDITALGVVALRPPRGDPASPPVYALVLSTPGGDVVALKSPDLAEIDRVAAAIRDVVRACLAGPSSPAEMVDPATGLRADETACPKCWNIYPASEPRCPRCAGGTARTAAPLIAAPARPPEPDFDLTGLPTARPRSWTAPTSDSGRGDPAETSARPSALSVEIDGRPRALSDIDALGVVKLAPARPEIPTRWSLMLAGPAGVEAALISTDAREVSWAAESVRDALAARNGMRPVAGGDAAVSMDARAEAKVTPGLSVWIGGEYHLLSMIDALGVVTLAPARREVPTRHALVFIGPVGVTVPLISTDAGETARTATTTLAALAAKNGWSSPAASGAPEPLPPESPPRLDERAVRAFVEDHWRAVLSCRNDQPALREVVDRFPDQIERMCATLPRDQADAFARAAVIERQKLIDETNADLAGVAARLGVTLPSAGGRSLAGEVGRDVARTAVRAAVWGGIFALFNNR